MFDVYQKVTDRLVEMMEGGEIPWHKPWSGTMDGAINYESRKPYSMLNQMLLGKPGEWLTYNQVTARKGKIRKGAQSGFVVFFKWMEETEKDENGEERLHRWPLLRYYNVFHIDDCEGIQSKLTPAEVVRHEPDAEAERVVASYLDRENGLKLTVCESNRAYYSPARDEVVVPSLSQYEVLAEYYSTLFHELTHSTARESRCNREVDEVAFFGSESYSREELVAELGASMLCNVIGLEHPKQFRNSAAYLKGWLKALKNDNRMIVWAAARAEKAADYIRFGKKEEVA